MAIDTRNCILFGIICLPPPLLDITKGYIALVKDLLLLLYHHIRMEEDFMGDQELQMLNQKFQMVPPFLECPSRRESTDLCSNARCKLPSFICPDEHCPQCSKHSTCQTIRLRIITDLVRGVADKERQFLMRIYEIEDLAIKQIQKMRRQQLERHRFASLEGKFHAIVEALYMKSKSVALTGQSVSEFGYALKDRQGEMEHAGKQLLGEFRKEMENTVATIAKDLQTKIDRFCLSSGPKQPGLLGLQELRMKPLKSEFQSQKYEQMNILQTSKIISKDHSAQIQIIHQNLLEPRGLELLFRASEHKFSAKQFHRICDNIEFTLTLFLTEFGSKVAGFSPNSWNSSIGWSSDPTESTFILSLDLMERMELKQSEKAIFCHEDWGPCFGDDITVGDGGSGVNCETKFPSTFRSKKLELALGSQKGRQMMFGQIKGNRFKIIEYEVYRVIW